ncbi:MAG: hypothetical protein R3B09_06570 [Nannocystaceae bacterium]
MPDYDSNKALDPAAARVRASDTPALLQRLVAIDASATARERKLRAAEQLARRGTQELRAGAVLTSIGVGGLALFGSGFGVEYDRRRKLDAIRGHESEYDLRGCPAERWRTIEIGIDGVIHS